MCTSVGIGLALLAAGTAASTYAGNMRADAMDDAQSDTLAAEMLRQEQYDREKQSKLADIIGTTAGRENVDAAMEEAAARHAAAMLENDSTPSSAEEGYASKTGTSQPRVVQNALERRRAENKDTLAAEADAMARMGSLGNALAAFSQQRVPHLAAIDASNSFARESASIMPYELQEALRKASKKGQTLSTVGAIASMVGGAMMGGAGAGAGAASAGTTGAATGAVAGSTPGTIAGVTGATAGASSSGLGMGLGSLLSGMYYGGGYGGYGGYGNSGYYGGYY